MIEIRVLGLAAIGFGNKKSFRGTMSKSKMKDTGLLSEMDIDFPLHSTETESLK